MTDERGLADEQVGGRLRGVPARHCGPGPAADGDADDTVGDAGLLGIAPARGAGLERRAREVPLEQVNASSAGAREVRELMDQQTLAGAGQAGEEETARLARQARQCHEQRRALAQEHAFG